MSKSSFVITKKCAYVKWNTCLHLIIPKHWIRCGNIDIGEGKCIHTQKHLTYTHKTNQPRRRQAVIWTNARNIVNSTLPWEPNLVKSQLKLTRFNLRKYIWKCRLRNGGHVVSAPMYELWQLHRIYCFISFSLMDDVDPNFECISNSIKKD